MGTAPKHLSLLWKWFTCCPLICSANLSADHLEKAVKMNSSKTFSRHRRRNIVAIYCFSKVIIDVLDNFLFITLYYLLANEPVNKSISF